MVYRVLACDGGGVRGLLTATVIHRLVLEVPDLLDKVHLLAGTSTGGLIALALAKGVTPQRLVDLYRNRSKEIFDDSWLDSVRDLGGLSGADYDNKNLKKIVGQLLGTTTKLGDLSKSVLVPAFDLDNGLAGAKRRWKPKFFHNLSGADSDAHAGAVHVALRTSAAPTYFPSYQGYVDGGVVANNPSMAAVALVLDERNGTGVTLDQIKVLSLGTGAVPQFVEGESLDWGFGQWARPLINLMLDGTVGVADFQCEQLLGSRYFRFSPDLPSKLNIQLDDADRVEELFEFASAISITALVKWVKATW